MTASKNSTALFLLMVLLPTVAVLAQSRKTATPQSQTLTANDLVRLVINNELASKDSNQNRWMYRVDREEQGTKTTKEVVQVGEGSLDRVVAVDGRSLNSKEQSQENQRIASFIKNTAEQRKVAQAKQKDAEQCRTFFKMFPDAFVFSYAGREGNLIKLAYHPNPAFQPPTREARVFHDMEGEMWIHASQHRLVRIRGQLTADVKFAGGLLGHLEKGGQFEVQQQELSPGQWSLTYMGVDMKGKALLFKNIAVQQKEYRSDFRPVPNTLTLTEAANMLTSDVLLARR